MTVREAVVISVVTLLLFVPLSGAGLEDATGKRVRIVGRFARTPPGTPWPGALFFLIVLCLPVQLTLLAALLAPEPRAEPLASLVIAVEIALVIAWLVYLARVVRSR